MIRFLGSAIYNIGLSNVRFIIDNFIYEYETHAYHVDRCERMSRFSDMKALNYIKKNTINTIKSKRKGQHETFSI